MRAYIIALALAAPLGACGEAREPVRPDEVAGPFAWGAATNVTHVRHLWFSGQPDEAALETARQEGVEVVINLREPLESEWDEKGAAERLGLTYYSVPVAREAPFSRASFEAIEALVKEHEGQQILIHCSSANRAGGWFATHLVADHGMSLEDALAVGRRVGITQEAIVQKVADYLAASPSRGAGAARSSD